MYLTDLLYLMLLTPAYPLKNLPTFTLRHLSFYYYNLAYVLVKA